MSSEWKTYTLADVAFNGKEGLIDGPFGSALPADLYQSDGIPVIRGSNLSKGEVRFKGDDFVFVSEEVASRLARATCIPEDIVFTKKGTLGQVGIIPTDRYPAYLLSSNQMRLRVNKEVVLPEFAYYYLSQKESIEKIVRDSEHTGVPKINLAYLRSFPIVVPPISEQRYITTVLNILDDRIALLRETNATLEAMAQALFKSWFVDFDPVRANAGTRAATLPAELQALFPSTFTDTPQGPVPEGWKWVTLDQVSEVGIGKTPPRKEQHWFSEDPNGIRWVSIRDMGMCGTYIATTSEFLTQEAVERFNVRVVPANTAMLSFKMTIGRVAISDGAMTTNEAIAHFKLGEKSPISSEVIYLHLKSFDYSILSSTSSIADAVNSKTVKSIPILLAETSVLAEFQNRVEPIFGKIKVIEQQAQTLATLRDTLLPRLISGQLRLSDAEAALVQAGA